MTDLTPYIIPAIIVLAVVFIFGRFLAGLIAIVLALGIIGFVALVILDYLNGGSVYLQLYANFERFLAGVTASIVAAIALFFRSRQTGGA